MPPFWLRKRLNKGYTPGVVSGLRYYASGFNVWNFRQPAQNALNALKRGGSYANANRTLQEIRARNEAFKPYSKMLYSMNRDQELYNIAQNFKKFNININTTLRRIQNLKNARIEKRKQKLIKLKNNLQKAQWSPYSSISQSQFNTNKANILRRINTNNGSGYDKLYSMYLHRVYRHAMSGNTTSPYH